MIQNPLLPSVVRTGLLIGSLLTVLIDLPARSQSSEVLDEIVAVVEGEILLRSDVDALVESFVRQQGVTYTPEIWWSALTELVDQKVLLVHAERDTNVVVTPEQISRELDMRVARLAAQSGGEQQLEEIYGKPVEQIKTELRDGVREQLLTSEFARMKLQNVKVTPSEVREWFARIPQDSLPTLPEIVRVSHIVRLPEPEPEAREEAMQIITTIRDSVATTDATIEDLAVFSDDEASVPNGGRYAGIRLSELVPEFGAVAANLEPGQLSHIFETPFGLHFMRLNQRVGDILDFNHILIRIDKSRVNPQPAIEFLQAVKDSLDNHGKQFPLMAKAHSEEPMSAARGGIVVDPRTQERDLILDALGPMWQRTLLGMNPGDSSEPAEFELLDGRRAWHIVLLQDRIPTHRVSLDTDYDRIEQLVVQEKRLEHRIDWLETLKQDTYVQLLVSPDGAPGPQAG